MRKTLKKVLDTMNEPSNPAVAALPQRSLVAPCLVSTSAFCQVRVSTAENIIPLAQQTGSARVFVVKHPGPAKEDKPLIHNLHVMNRARVRHWSVSS
jgi:hypothetical protein